MQEDTSIQARRPSRASVPRGDRLEALQKYQDENLEMLTVEDVQLILCISRNSAYKLMHARGFPTVRINSRLLVSKKDLADWIESRKGKEAFRFSSR